MESKGGRGDCKEENKGYHAYSRSILLFEVVSLEEEERKCQQKVFNDRIKLYNCCSTGG